MIQIGFLKNLNICRFIYVEVGFFSKWYVEQTDERKNLVKQLVNDGRLEFINGGWWYAHCS